MKVFFSFLFVFGIGTVAAQQGDSLDLRLLELGVGDLRDLSDIADEDKIITGGRVLQNKKEIPFTAIIISKEEILENGYVTLVDILKYLPGVRVSQPGSAVEGELFIMRGLKGNSYVKILIDNVPIKPSIVGGMPIGAQLPIKQAERIEIIYGPAAVLYGADASAGVINIITKESDRPVYVQADLSIGTQGFTHLDILFGGKLGKGNNVVSYAIAGSNTMMDSRRIFYNEDELYNPSNYTRNPGVDTMYVNSPNYVGSTFVPVLEKTPHLSRMVSATFKYKFITSSTHLMYRRDHSSLGLSPLAVSYANPNNFYGENILRTNLNIAKNYKKWGFNSNLTYIRYNLDENTSYTYIEEKLSRISGQLISNIQDPFTRDSLRQLSNETYFKGQRYSYALSNDIRVEPIFYIAPNENIDISMGINWGLSLGQPIISYRSAPVTLPDFVFNIDTSNLWRMQPAPIFYTDRSFFTQAQFNFEKFRGMVGYRYYRNSIYGSAHTPQAAILYKVAESFNIRANYGLAFRVPSPFYNANIFEINIESIDEIEVGDEDLGPEKTSNYELGIRYQLDKIFEADLSAYYTQTENFLSYNFDNDDEVGEDIEEFTLGYFNGGDTKASIWGLQSHFKLNFDYSRFESSIELNMNYNKGSEILPREDNDDNLQEIDVVRGIPRFIGQLNLSTKFWKKSIMLNFNNIFTSSHVSYNVFSKMAYENDKSRFTNDGFYTLDILARYKISKNFQGHIKLINVFNAKYAGIDATGTLDDLAYNPQSLRMLFFGLSYRIE